MNPVHILSMRASLFKFIGLIAHIFPKKKKYIAVSESCKEII
jgi:hypothetical protein